MKSVKVFAPIAALMVIAVFAGCDLIAPVPVTGVSLNKTATNLVVGGTETLFANVKPDNAANKNITWISGSPAVATVSASGLVTGVSAGTAAIIVTTKDGGHQATCTVTVDAPPTNDGSFPLAFTVEQILDGAPIINAITISRTNTGGYPFTRAVSITASDYDPGSIKWETAGIGVYAGQTVSGNGSSFTLDARDTRYNSLGIHTLVLTVSKSGMLYQRNILFTIVQ